MTTTIHQIKVETQGVDRHGRPNAFFAQCSCGYYSIIERYKRSAALAGKHHVAMATAVRL